MKVKNRRDEDVIVVIPGRDPIEAEALGIIDVPDDIGRSLLDQPDNWSAYGVDTQTSVDTVLAQVAGDRAKARRALDDEQSADKPRKTLVDALTKIIDTEDS